LKNLGRQKLPRGRPKKLAAAHTVSFGLEEEDYQALLNETERTGETKPDVVRRWIAEARGVAPAQTPAPQKMERGPPMPKHVMVMSNKWQMWCPGDGDRPLKKSDMDYLTAGEPPGKRFTKIDAEIERRPVVVPQDVDMETLPVAQPPLDEADLEWKT
jgi:hypothetical protein